MYLLYWYPHAPEEKLGPKLMDKDDYIVGVRSLKFHRGHTI